MNAKSDWRVRRVLSNVMTQVTNPGGAFDAHRFAMLASVEDRNPWFRSRNLLIQWALRAHFPEARDVLEVGCGTGYVLAGLHKAFPELRLTGLEAGEEGLVFARQRVPDATFVVADARTLEYDADFDVTCAFDVLEHIDDDRAVLQQLRRADRSGGGLILTVPQHQWLWSASDVSAGHLRRYDRNKLVAMVESTGFRVLRVTSFVSLLLPALAAARLLRRSGAAYDVEVALRPRPFLDQIAAALFAAERSLIAAGVTLPAGSSLLLIAQRT
jgi:SAM-dependent methyltransferase